MNHDGHNSCQHLQIAYCRMCDAAYCRACAREWKQQAWWYVPTTTWTYPTQYGTSTIPTYTAGGTGTTSCAHT